LPSPTELPTWHCVRLQLDQWSHRDARLENIVNLAFAEVSAQVKVVLTYVWADEARLMNKRVGTYADPDTHINENRARDNPAHFAPQVDHRLTAVRAPSGRCCG
jgi:hypothetical protein